ncbi:hypothetical protein [Pseudobutyrivibrio sp.]|jgi:hypothetical protein|uniref:hypothetical protein n=1 Tax=Pseudobutyrivibrio sp. TaxID=2014367 RepID=UPI003863CFA6
MKICNFDDWEIWDGASEGTGRSEKEWLRSAEGQVGLFKYPKSNETTEYISEHLAYKLGVLLEVPTAKIDIGTRNNRLGSMSYQINKEKEAIIEGVNFIIGAHPLFNSDTLFDDESGMYYCMEFIFHSFNYNPEIRKFLIQMMMFDFLIGNSDRHQNNWAVLFRYDRGSTVVGELDICPLYDNGSSLCCYESEASVEDYLKTRDLLKFNALVDSKSISLIRIDGNRKKKPTHRKVIEHLINKYDYAKDVGYRFLKRLDDDTIRLLVDEYPDEIISFNRKQLIIKYLIRKRDILQEVLDEQYTTEKEK